MFKIKINCTTIDDLSFYGKKISKQNYNKIVNSLITIEDEELERIQIVYKHYKKTTTKALEIFIKINIEFCDSELVLLIHKIISKMKASGFYSKNNKIIQLIDIKTNTCVLYYTFTTVIKIDKNDTITYKKNKSHYSTYILYKKS